MAQCIHLNQNNRSVLASRYSVLGEKTSPILLLLVGLTYAITYVRVAGRQTKPGGIETFKILYRLNSSGIYFVYHCNITTVIELHFSQLLPSKAYFKVHCEL